MAENKRSFEYRGHKVTLTREECMGGWEMTYFYITDADGFELECDFSEGEDTLDEYVSYMKERIDGELADDNPWGLWDETDPDPYRCIIENGNLVRVQ